MASTNNREYDEKTSYGADEMLLSDTDYAAVQQYKTAWQSATDAGDTTAAKAAHDAAEAIRANYNYSGGGDGGGYSPLSSQSTGYTSAASKPTYTSSYQDQIDQIYSSLSNRAAFSYDYETDPLYQQYKDSYTREGNRAMQDTLGQVASRTGGQASSWAASAASQANNYYMSQLADKIPELYQLAYSMYQDEGNEQRSNLELLESLEQGDYAKYQDLLNQYNIDENRAYQQYSDDWSRDFSQSQFDWERLSDMQSQNLSQQQLAWQQETDQRDFDYNASAEKAALLAGSGDYSGYASLWELTQEQTSALVAQYAQAQQTSAEEAARALATYYAQYGDFSKLSELGVNTGYLSQLQNAELASLYSSGSSGSSGSSTRYSTGSNSGGSSGIVDSMLALGNDTKAYEYLIGLGYTNAQVSTLWKLYQQQQDSGASGESTAAASQQIDYNSVLALGYGPISDSYLAELEASGRIVRYVENGKVKFRKSGFPL